MAEMARKPSFGTSGLRGEADLLTDDLVAAYARGFVELCGADGPVLVGYDRRGSSPRIAAAVLAGIKAAGRAALFAGFVPTPALAAYGLDKGWTALMVTASHNPPQHNGIKFFRPDGEMTKADEADLTARAEALLGLGVTQPAPLPAPDTAIADAYVRRFTDFFAADALKGLRIGLDLHSAAGRHLLQPIFAAAGADCVIVRESDDFIAVDTEAIAAPYLRQAREWASEHQLDAIISTDGDGDRPLLIAADGRQVMGDVLGLLAARALGFSSVVTPASSISSVERSGYFQSVLRTRIGSPHVIAGMRMVGGDVAGFEANGGFLTGADVVRSDRRLPALPTRDAILPLLATLELARGHAGGLAGLLGTLPERVKTSGVLRGISRPVADAFIALLRVDADGAAGQLLARMGGLQRIETVDGVQLIGQSGDSVHFRPSGNAPELRIYVESADEATAQGLLRLAEGTARGAISVT